MEKLLTYAQSIHEIPHDYPPNKINKPHHESAVAIILDGKENAVVVQLITPLFKGKKVMAKSEIDVIHFAARNVPTEKLYTHSQRTS